MKYSEAKKAIQDVGRSELEDLLNKCGEGVIAEYQNYGYSLSDFEEAYQGEYKNDEEFTRELLESCGEIPKFPSYIHIDWEATARDIMQDYFEIQGHYFRAV